MLSVRVWPVVAAGFSIALGLAGPALANTVSQAGYTSPNSSTITGAQAGLVANNGFAPNGGACVIQSVNLEDIAVGAVERQVEVGYLRCNGAVLDLNQGACQSGYRFVEVYNIPTGYTCYQHAAFGVGASNTFAVSRPAGGAVARAYINGTSYEAQSGYDLGTNEAFAWMEYIAPDGYSCSGWGPASGTFGSWEQGSGSAWVNGAGSQYHSPLNCWTIGVLNGSNSFTVSK